VTDYFGPWVTPAVEPGVELYATVTPAKVSASADGGVTEGPLDRVADGEIVTADNPALVSRNYVEWSSVIHSPPAITYLNGAAGLRFRTERNYGREGIDYLQQVTNPRANALHPAVRGGLPPGVVGVQFDGPIAGEVGAWTLTAGYTAGVADAGVAATIPQPFQFQVRADDVAWSGGIGSGGQTYYGFSSLNYPSLSLWDIEEIGTVSTSGIVTAETDLSFPEGQTAVSLWVRLSDLGAGIEGNAAYASYLWRVGVSSMTFAGQVTWPAYRYAYDSPQGGMWSVRQRQTPSGNTGGWPLRQRHNGGATGSWPLRQRQAGN